MHYTKNITDSVIWIGGSDRRQTLFESIYPIPDGASYNSYLIMDEKIAVMDTVDSSVMELFFENLNHVLCARTPDYIIINHMEPDHCAALGELSRRYPEARIVGNSKTLDMIGQFFDIDMDSRCIEVSEGSSLELGKHRLSFYMAPMVHWPEAMVTYEHTEKMLFSADAFGTFGAHHGSIFADEVDFGKNYLSEARRYYSNIVGKYGAQTLSLLNKATTLDIKYLCPLHGFIWRKEIEWFIDKYKKWGGYLPEDNAVVIFYGSIYGNTENAAQQLAYRLSDKGIRDIKLYDTSRTDVSYMVSEAFRARTLIFAASTYNGGIFTSMRELIEELISHNLKNRNAAVIENGTWAPTSGKQMKELLCSMQNFTILEPTVSLRSSLKPKDVGDISLLAENIYSAMTDK